MPPREIEERAAKGSRKVNRVDVRWIRPRASARTDRARAPDSTARVTPDSMARVAPDSMAARVACDSTEIRVNRDWTALNSTGQPLPLEWLPEYYTHAAKETPKLPDGARGGKRRRAKGAADKTSPDQVDAYVTAFNKANSPSVIAAVLVVVCLLPLATMWLNTPTISKAEFAEKRHTRTVEAHDAYMLAAMQKVPMLERGEGFTVSAKTGDIEQTYSMQHTATLPASPSPTVSPTVSPPSSPSPTAEAEPPPTTDARPQGAAQHALGFSTLFLSAKQSAAVFTWTIKQVEAEVR